MSIAVNMNDPTNTGVKTNDRQRVDDRKQRCRSAKQFPDLTGRAIEEPGPD